MSRSLSLLLLLTLLPLGVHTAAAARVTVTERPEGIERPASPAGEAPGLSPIQALQRAAVEGKYRNLLAVISVPRDRDTYTEFNDYGYSNTPSWGGYSRLPAAYWVYVAPHWYLWQDQTTVSPPAVLGTPAGGTGRNWGPEQATGEPDTEGSGDLVTAWASRTQDEQDEWLELEYDHAFQPTGVIVHETFHPGALNRITMFQSNSEETDVWRGTDPTPRSAEHGVSIVPVTVPFETNKIRLYLASKEVPGWNEIDAVGLVDSLGKTHWAVRAQASSTYAESIVPGTRVRGERERSLRKRLSEDPQAPRG